MIFGSIKKLSSPPFSFFTPWPAAINSSTDLPRGPSPKPPSPMSTAAAMTTSWNEGQWRCVECHRIEILQKKCWKLLEVLESILSIWKVFADICCFTTCFEKKHPDISRCRWDVWICSDLSTSRVDLRGFRHHLKAGDVGTDALCRWPPCNQPAIMGGWNQSKLHRRRRRKQELSYIEPSQVNAKVNESMLLGMFYLSPLFLFANVAGRCNCMVFVLRRPARCWLQPVGSSIRAVYIVSPLSSRLLWGHDHSPLVN